MNFTHLKDYIIDSIVEMKHYLGLKLMGGAGGVFMFAFGDLKVEIIEAITILVAFDFITGLGAAKVQGREIKSSIAFRTPFKYFIYILMLISSHQLGIIIPPVEAWLIGGMSGFLGINEFISVIENIGNMGFKTPKNLLNKLKKVE